MKEQNNVDLFKSILGDLKKELWDKGNKQAHQDAIKTMFKVIENLIVSPTDPKVRKLPKTNKAVQSKLLAHQFAVEYLTKCGFDFMVEDAIVLSNYNETLLKCAKE